MKYVLLLAALIFYTTTTVFAQEESVEDFKRYDIFPAISYSPETDLTLGLIGYRYLQLGSQATTTRSFVNFVAVYTTKQQIVVESEWDVFLKDNEYRIRGTMGYNKFPDRNYGLGNNASAIVQEFEREDGIFNTGELNNYVRYDIDRISFRPVVLKKLVNNLYTGLLFDLEYQYNYEIIPDSVQISSGLSEITEVESNIEGLNTGVGLNVIWDSRDNLLNPRSGSFIELTNTYFGSFVGSDFSFSNLRFDLRKYWNPIKNHTLAIRGNAYWTFADRGDVPIRALSRIGGPELSRGYFRGTYQDRNLIGWQTEYRLPFWEDDTDAPFRRFWKRLGVVVFASGAQVYGDTEDFDLGNFNHAIGTGLRILFNKESRLNLRVDYAFALSSDSNGPGSRQTGLYFFLAEAF